jgi:hypothetical protein
MLRDVSARHAAKMCSKLRVVMAEKMDICNWPLVEVLEARSAVR